MRLQKVSQELLRQEIQQAVDASRLSLRQIAERSGLRGHAALSRFLAGKQELSLETIFQVAITVKISPESISRMLQSVLPEELRRSIRIEPFTNER